MSIQESVVEGEIRDEELTNGDKFVLFKSADILSFFQMIDQHFAELKKSEPTMANISPLTNTELVFTLI